LFVVHSPASENWTVQGMAAEIVFSHLTEQKKKLTSRRMEPTLLATAHRAA